MNLDDYTDDAICRSMGIGALVPDADNLGGITLRILFKPSFDPEVAITFVTSPEYSRAHIVALRTMLWLERMMCRMPEESERTALETNSVSELVESFVAHAQPPEAQDRSICIDGMGISAVMRRGGDTISTRGNSSARHGLRAVATHAIQLTWNATETPGVKNALARVARYLGQDCPLVTIPPAPPITRLLILGAPDERQEYFQMLEPAKKET
jgi:hypothetical protein